MNHSLEYICKICHTPCNNQSIYKQKLDIPFKSTSLSYIIFALLFISSSLQNFVLPYWFFPIVLFFSQTVNIPLIVYLSRKNNFENMAAARQKTNSLAWNRTHNQQWELNCAREQRNQAPQMPVLESSFWHSWPWFPLESFNIVSAPPVLCTYRYMKGRKHFL